MTTQTGNSYLNPYLAGFLLGITLLASFMILGTGLGASGGLARLSAWCGLCINPEQILNSEYFGKWGAHPLKYYLVFMFAGTLIGGFVSALLNRRISVQVERGTQYSAWKRLILALLGGVIAGFATRLARGCTSGMALTGTALLTTGGVAFLLSTFAGGYLMAYFFRRQWHD
ncbi:MAG: YeeE/YedE family protein [Candidatus Riflebacteria bacterium]|nr:YeeE/YedE family protein [Candidatus Riflebacteria bacterium]